MCLCVCHLCSCVCVLVWVCACQCPLQRNGCATSWGRRMTCPPPHSSPRWTHCSTKEMSWSGRSPPGDCPRQTPKNTGTIACKNNPPIGSRPTPVCLWSGYIMLGMTSLPVKYCSPMLLVLHNTMQKHTAKPTFTSLGYANYPFIVS